MGKHDSHYAVECSLESQTQLRKLPFNPARKRPSSQGFTLVELMISLAIVGTLTAIAVPVTKDYYYKAQVVKAVADIRTMEREIVLFKLDVDKYPDDLAEIGRGSFLDPWGNPYMYLNIADNK